MSGLQPGSGAPAHLGGSLDPSVSEVAPSPNLGLYLGSRELGLLTHRRLVSPFARFLGPSLNGKQAEASRGEKSAAGVGVGGVGAGRSWADLEIEAPAGQATSSRGHRPGPPPGARRPPPAARRFTA